MSKTMKKIDKDELKQLIAAIRQFKKETRDDEVDAATSRISNKDILFFFLAQNAALETRVTKIETTQKLSLWFVGIALAIISIGIGVFKL
jgi:hypothetical protein